MMLVIGGKACGKEDWARQTLQADPVACTPEQAITAPAILDFHETVRALIADGADIEQYIARLCSRNPNAVVLCDEVGMGVIPLLQEERLWREAVGRACCLLQKECAQVVRVVCGIPIYIKGVAK